MKYENKNTLISEIWNWSPKSSNSSWQHKKKKLHFLKKSLNYFPQDFEDSLANEKLLVLPL